jgi:hypothetical protein
MRALALFAAAGCAPLGSAMHPADVLDEDETHVGYATGVIAPVPARSRASEVASPTGFSQEVQVRRGFEDAWEAGIRIAPAQASVDARFHLFGEDDDWQATFGGGLGAGFADLADPGEGHRFVALAEVLAGKNWSDVIRLWVGPRAQGVRYDGRHGSGFGGTAGLTLGVAAGYRWIFAAAELTPLYDFGEKDVLLEPAFGLWVRW